MDLKIMYEDNDLLVIDKPAGTVVFPEGQGETAFASQEASTSQRKTLIDYLLESRPDLKNAGEAPRYGIIHRLDKDTSGILLVAKNNESLIFFQKQFKNREIEKKYTALTTGIVKENQGTIKTLIGRSPKDPRKQKAYSLEETNKTGKREAITEYKVLKRFAEYTLLGVNIKTGRKHQIRCHLASIHHPIAGDKVYGFKDSPLPKGLTRQFLHASYTKVQLPSGEFKELTSDLPEDLKEVLEKLI